MKTRIPPPVVAVVFALLMWLVASSFTQSQITVPARGAASMLLVLVGLGIMGLAMQRFRSVGTTVNPLDPSRASSLVSSGIFGRSRNPMYLGIAILLCAWTVWLGNVLNVAVLGLFIWFMTTFQIKPEEEALTRVFGEPYDDYRKKVRRWL